ncbi:hypothetical protein LCGC14_2342050 [marine sediment metagenome]|uniref:Uncharacterized protein n=1 Tax=marine sediment metagenome TaxID=412755 RepID=A0A0F9F6W6_9ZZZZ
MDCTCVIQSGELQQQGTSIVLGYSIAYCPMHKAAPAMLAVLKEQHVAAVGFAVEQGGILARKHLASLQQQLYNWPDCSGCIAIAQARGQEAGA